MAEKALKNVAIIVARPNDETLWAGGTILSHPSWNCFIISVCSEKDEEKVSGFYRALKVLRADGIMGDLDNGEEQPMSEELVEQTILDLLPEKHYDLIISHNPNGEYTGNLRHEEVCRAIITLWNNNKIKADELRTFAYEDGNKKYPPRPVKEAAIYRTLTKRIWLRKYSILNEIYGFDEESQEIKTAPRDEAFWQFINPFNAKKWLNNGGVFI